MPKSLDWRPEYSVGNDTLDSQHIMLLELCKRVSGYVCDGSKTSIKAFQSILNELVAYASMHFQTEERMLEQAGYPMLVNHKASHDKYSDTMVEYLIESIDGGINSSALSEFLKQWWLNHILVSDMDYRDYVKNRA